MHAYMWAAQVALEGMVLHVAGPAWDCRIHPSLVKDGGRFRSYNFGRVTYLLLANVLFMACWETGSTSAATTLDGCLFFATFAR